MRALLSCLFVGLCLFLFSLSSPGCQSTAQEPLQEVWVQSVWPPEDTPAPLGFSVTPAQAYRQVAASRRLSLKHIWACYHDADNYYIFDTFITSATPENALKYGVKIPGRIKIAE